MSSQQLKLTRTLCVGRERIFFISIGGNLGWSHILVIVIVQYKWDVQLFMLYTQAPFINGENTMDRCSLYLFFYNFHSKVTTSISSEIQQSNTLQSISLPSRQHCFELLMVLLFDIIHFHNKVAWSTPHKKRDISVYERPQMQSVILRKKTQLKQQCNTYIFNKLKDKMFQKHQEVVKLSIQPIYLEVCIHLCSFMDFI